jgi:hypothetical protein
MDHRRRAVLIMPERPAAAANPGRGQIDGNVHVTFHDMLAVNYAERTLVLGQFADHDLVVSTVSGADEASELITEQLVLICSPRANSYSRRAVEYLQTKYPSVGMGFERVSDEPERWQIRFKGAVYLSPTYAEIDLLREQGKSPANGPLTDYALLGRFPNPWNPSVKTILIAGIRGIGTWGAARHLRERAHELAKEFDGRDFVVIVKVGYRDYKITDTEIVNRENLGKASAT